MSESTSKVLTLVFTDLADSTALKARHGDRAVEIDQEFALASAGRGTK